MAEIGETRRPPWLWGWLELMEEVGEQLGCVSQDLSKEPLMSQSWGQNKQEERAALGRRMSAGGWKSELRIWGVREEGSTLGAQAASSQKAWFRLTILFPKEESYGSVLVGNAKSPLLHFLTTHLPHTLNLTKGKKKSSVVTLAIV